jgi:amidophosphoribosyltransferase
MHEECGVVGIYTDSCEMKVSRAIFFALFSLQHRGQEACGIASTDGKEIYSYKNTGLVTQVFKETDMERLPGHIAIGHTRYSTLGGNDSENIQPLISNVEGVEIALAHNGQLIDYVVDEEGKSDSWEIIRILREIVQKDQASCLTSEHLMRLVKQVSGAYSLVIMTNDSLFGVRDSYGFRPLCIGKLNDGGLCLASESCALNTIGATRLREVQPGEVICINKDGLNSINSATDALVTSFCIFEYIYFARPDSILEDKRLVHTVRQDLGKRLAIEHPCQDADIVIGVPDSSIAMAIGYAHQSKIPYTEGLIKNRYIARTFIQPNPELRTKTIKLKFNVLADNLHGKNIVLVDDSIVRGNTMMHLIEALREAKPASIHVRIASPPIRYSCYMGVDIPNPDDLIARQSSDICRYIGADSLQYISMEGVLVVLNKSNYCTGCFTGQYPVPTIGCKDIEDLCLDTKN